MSVPSVLIVGASIAGPALAAWLGRAGWRVTIIEKAPQLRSGGQAVDFRTPSHFAVLERMGILPAMEAVATGGGAMRFIDTRGRTRLYLPEEFAGGALEVQRGDLSRLLYEASSSTVTYRFGHSLARLAETPDGVEVACDNGWAERFDLVIGADGIHSRTRRLALGASHETFLGYYVAGWDAPGLSDVGADAVYLNAPGRAIGMAPGRPGTPPSGRAFFAASELDEARGTLAQQKALIRRMLTGLGWRTPELLAELDRADDVFLSPISRADPPNWSAGRVALLGDAACGATIGGMGTGTAILGAYLLAGELLAAKGDHTAAFARYQQRLQPYARACAANGEHTGRFHAPRTTRGLWLRNTLLSFPPIKRWMIAEAGKLGGDIELPDYPDLRLGMEVEAA